MSGRSLQFQTFLERFAELKVAAGNDPNLLTKYDQATDELHAAAAGLNVDDIEHETFHGSEKMIAHVPAEFEKSWADFKRRWEAPLNHFAMCEIDPEWPRDYEEHIKIYEGSGVVPDEKDDMFLPAFHDGPVAIRQAIDYLQDHDECRAGLKALKYLIDTVGIDLVAIMGRWQKLPVVFMPKHVAQQQQMSKSGPLAELFEDAVRAYVCGAPAAAFTMCRALLETVIKQSYVPGEFTEEDHVPLNRLLALTARRYGFVPIVKIRKLVRTANAILHSYSSIDRISLDDELEIIEFFRVLKLLIERAPAPRSTGR